jgi:hypothetical protein
VKNDQDGAVSKVKDHRTVVVIGGNTSPWEVRQGNGEWHYITQQDGRVITDALHGEDARLVLNVVCDAHNGKGKQ